MPRPRRDGTPAAAPNRRKLSELLLQKLRPAVRPYCVWDSYQRGLCVLVQTTGHKAFKCVYPHGGQNRWYHIAAVDAVGLADARKIANRVMTQAADGKDPVAERKALRSRGTFGDLATRYVEEHAKRHNKSWKQADALVRRHLLPRWSKLAAETITRADAKAAVGRIKAPIVANQALAAASAIFSWGVKQEIVPVNPCAQVERNPTRARERVLSDREIPKFWAAFDSAGLVASSALKVILLTGQRPGEVARMRREHIVDGWWELPGDPVPALGWPGTKNGESHLVWLPAAAQDLIAELSDDLAGFIFGGERGGAPRNLDAAMRAVCADLKVERATPHDLRRTHGSTITALGFGRDAMNRVQNHRDGGIADVYDRHEYADENKRVMETVAKKITALVGGVESNVVQINPQARS